MAGWATRPWPTAKSRCLFRYLEIHLPESYSYAIYTVLTADAFYNVVE